MTGAVAHKAAGDAPAEHSQRPRLPQTPVIDLRFCACTDILSKRMGHP